MSEDSPKPMSWDLSSARIGIVAARFNQALVDNLVEKVSQALASYGQPESLLTLERTPGSNEIPVAASLLTNGIYDLECIITLGVVIKGSTDHHHLVGQSTSLALQDLSIKTEIPIINGIIVTDTREQAIERIEGTMNRGFQFANAAAEMIELRRKWKNR
jgi:6,7-dimethyl-8-ribityllumazine synthase